MTVRIIDRPARCPFCRASTDFIQEQCDECGEDLTLLANLRGLPYALYNEALVHLHDDDRWDALGKLLAAVALDRKFDEAKALLSQVSRHLGLKELSDKYCSSAERVPNQTRDE